MPTRDFFMFVEAAAEIIGDFSSEKNEEEISENEFNSLFKPL